MEYYNIFLAAPFNPEKKDKRLLFYNKLKTRLKKIRKNVFLIQNLNNSGNLMYDAESALRDSELVLMDIGRASNYVETILEFAIQDKKRIIAFRNIKDLQNFSEDKELHRNLSFSQAQIIEFEKQEEGLLKIILAVKKAIHSEKK